MFLSYSSAQFCTQIYTIEMSREDLSRMALKDLGMNVGEDKLQ